MEHKNTAGMIPIFYKVFFGMCVIAVLIVACFFVIYYQYSKNVVEKSITENINTIKQNCNLQFQLDYGFPISSNLRFLESSVALNEYLMSSTDEQFIAIVEVEKLFSQMIRNKKSCKRLLFFDHEGNSRVHIANNKRIRSVLRIDDSTKMEPAYRTLFENLKKSTEGTIRTEGPFVDSVGSVYFLVGISKLEPEVGGFGGAIMTEISIDEYLQFTAQAKLYNYNLITVFTEGGQELLSSIQKGVDENKMQKVFPNDQMLSLEIGEQEVLRLYFSIPQEVRDEQVAPLVARTQYLSLFILCLSLGFAALLSKRITSPIHELVETIAKLESGDLTARSNIRSHDETALLARSFNTLVTNLITSTEEIEKEKRITERSLKSKSEFLKVISHEIRTPVNAVMVYSEQLQGSILSDTQKKYLNAIWANGSHLVQLVDDMLSIQNIEQGEIILDMQEFNLVILLKELHAHCRKLLKDSPVSLNLLIDSEFNAQIIGDRSRLRQALLHILHNAIKFTKKGTIDFAVEKKVIISSDRLIMQFVITDTGPGIPLEHQKSVFNPFFQSDMSDTRKFGGAGLGLSISHSFIAAMDGSITIDSNYTEGVRCIVEIPFSIAAQKSAESTIQKKEQANYLHVLVVEDNIVNQKVITMLLERLQCSFDVVDNGRKAVEATSEVEYDIVLMDIQMPVMNGIDATVEIRQQLDREELPIVALTAAAFQSDRERCLNAGMNDFITKPIEIGKFKEVLKGYGYRE